MRRGMVVTLLSIALSMQAQNAPAPNPAMALRDARNLIAARDYAGAAKLLENGLADASSMPTGAQRDQAFTALHFYAAVAYSGAHDDANARRHLNEYFRLSPKSNQIDATKFDARFVAMFNELAPNRPKAEGDSFEMYYPAFAPGATPSATDLQTTDAAAIEILGSSAEKREWRALANAPDREHFVGTFWSRRDTTPDTADNEFRNDFANRLAFAEKVFGFDEKGVISDRGRVFTLLGRPSFVRRRPISRGDLSGHNAVWVPPATMINGTIEQWIYQREQLPIRLSKPTLTYRFVTQQGIGEGVLQKDDAYSMQALDAASNPAGSRK